MSTRPLAQTGCIASRTSRAEPFRVTGQVGVVDGRFQVACGLEAHRSARVQLRDQLGTVPAELGLQHLAEQGVVAVPLAPVVQRLHQDVPAPQPFEQTGGVATTPDGLAQVAVHRLEDRRPDQEVQVLARNAVQHLGAQVVAHQPILTGDPFVR